jgi:hypothetical protein
MTAKRNFRGGSEPTQTIIIPFPNQKSRLTQIIFRRNPLEQSVFEKPLQHHHRRRITCERASRKGIKMIYRQTHLFWLSLCSLSIDKEHNITYNFHGPNAS